MPRQVLAVKPDGAGLQIRLEGLEPRSRVLLERFGGLLTRETEVAGDKRLTHLLRRASRGLTIADPLRTALFAVLNERPSGALVEPDLATNRMRQDATGAAGL